MDNPTTPTAPLTAPARQLDFVSRLRAQTTQLLNVRKELKAQVEEAVELNLFAEFDQDVWSGDNPNLGAHAHISLQALGEAKFALDAIENLLVTENMLAPLLRIKE